MIKFKFLVQFPVDHLSHSVASCFILFFALIYTTLLFYSLRVFHISASWWFSTGVSIDSKPPQISRTLLSILADLNIAVVWRVSIRPVISKSSSPCINLLVSVPTIPITIGIIVTFMFHSFFNCLARAKYLSLFSNSFNFTLWSAGTAKSTILLVLSFFFFFFLLIIIKSSRLAEIRWSVCMSKSCKSLCVIVENRCWVVLIPFVHVFKLQFFALFPVDHLAHPVVPSLILFLC